MSITVLDAPTTYLLTTVARYKSYVGMTTEDNDAILEDMIRGASDFATRYIGRPLLRQRVTEDVAGKGTPEMLLTIRPIVSVSEVLDGETAITDFTIYDRDAGILQRSNCFRSTNIPFNTIDMAPSGSYLKNWHVTYTAGYTPAGWGESAGERTLPFDLERAIMSMVKSEFNSRNIDENMTKYKIGETQIFWDRKDNNTTLPRSAQTVLDYYRGFGV